MRKVKIYQIKDIEKTMYAFRDYNPDFNFDDYELVAEFEAELVAGTDTSLEMVFEMGNTSNEFRQKHPKMHHSVSVSDVIELDGKHYYVNNFKFVKLGF